MSTVSDSGTTGDSPSTPPDPATTTSWRLGVLLKKDHSFSPKTACSPELPGPNEHLVHWQLFSTENEARDQISSLLETASTILFQNLTDPIHFSSVHSNIDAAMILHASHICTSLDDTSPTIVDGLHVQSLVQRGELPMVPVNRPQLQQILLKKAMMITFTRPSVCFFASSPLKHTSLCYFDVRQHPGVRQRVALTLDDAPCRFKSRSNSQMMDVCRILDERRAKATFMVIGGYATEEHEGDLVEALRRGHELGNHGMLDRPYHEDTPDSFGRAVDDCNDIIKDLQRRAAAEGQGAAEVGVKWFRAPHGKYTVAMENELNKRGLKNVMCDTYASCPIVQDGEYIGRSLARNAKDGSIMLLHIPEKGFREWCMDALVILLDDLEKRGFTVVTVSELQKLAMEKGKK